MNISFERVTSLEYHFKAAVAEIAAFKSGKKYKSMEEKYEKELQFEIIGSQILTGR